MAISPINGHVSRALSFFKQDSLFFAIGRTTPWPNEPQTGSYTPPAPDVNSVAVEEVIAYKKVLERKLVVPDPAGTILYQGDTYREVTETNARTEKCTRVYITTQLIGSELPLSSYRQVGVYSRLVLKSGVPTSQSVLLPADVTDPGFLEVLDHRKVTHRQDDQNERLSLIIEF